MIPNTYLFALCCTLLTPLIILLSMKVLTSKMRKKWVLFGPIVFFIVGSSWFNIIFSNIEIFWLKILLICICSCVFSFFVLVITYNFIVGESVENNNEVKEKNYTIETLIGMEGVINSLYASGGYYLGFLSDGVNTNIVVKIDGNVKNGSHFKITSIENGSIYAILTD